MGYTRAKGVIIKGVNTGEADRVVTILTREYGKITGFAKSAKRPKSKLAAGSQLLCYSDFVLFKGKDMYNINSCDVIEPFYDIRNDIVRLTYAAHICDILNDTIQDEQSCARVLQLLLNTLHVLTKTDRSPRLAVVIFELRLLTILGYAPQVSGCISCGSDETAGIAFSFSQCGFICGNCKPAPGRCTFILPGTVRALQYIVYSRIKDLFSFNVSDEVLSELEAIVHQYLGERLDREYHTLDFLKTLQMP